MKILFMMLLLLSSVLSFSQKKKTKTTDPLAGVDTTLERIMNDRKVAGFAVAVVEKDKVIYAKGFGYRDYEKKLPVTPNTDFAIGSCTKAFTAMLIGLLNKEGKVEYDNPVRDYLPKLKFFNDELNDQVTVRDMMCHRTGLPRHDYSWYLFNTESRDTLMQRIKYMEPTARIRQTWQYNNFMFLLQGMIVEEISGKSWEDNIREKIFKPLGMTHSNLSIEELEKSEEPSLGYRVYKDSIIKKTDYYHINAMGPAGSINSNVNDMAKWVIAWINGGKVDSNEIFPVPYMKQAMSSQMVVNAGLPSEEHPDAHMANYGFGWFLSSYRGHYRVEHGGNIDGFSASTCFFPSDSIGIIVLTNQNGSPVTGLVRNTLADRLLKLKTVDWLGELKRGEEKAKAAAKDAEKNIISNKKEGTSPTHELSAYEGLFTNPGYGTMNIIVRNDSLILRTPLGEAWLRHYHYDVFETFPIDEKEGIDTTEKSQVNIQYHMNPAGDIVMLSLPLQPGLDDIEFKKIPKPAEIAKGDLEKYVGEYEFAPGAVAKFYIKGENTLYAFVQGQPEYELVALGDHKFSFKKLTGYSVQFEANDEGEIVAASFIQPNGTFKAKKKPASD